MQSQKERPLTVKEIQERKRKQRQEDQDKVCIKNLSSLQPIPVQIFGKNSTRAIHQTTIMIPPGKKVSLPRNRLINEQIVNLKSKGFISVDSDTSGIKSYKDFLNVSHKE